jgi:hypothetical protein
MSLSQVIYPPPTKNGWQEWAFAHYQHHLAILTAMREVKNADLPLYNIYPFDSHNPQGWLEQHQQQHFDFENILGVQGNDLTSVDFTNKKQLDGWLFLNYTSHQSAAAILGQNT